MNLTTEQIKQLTKAIVKHCIIPGISDFFQFPSFENIDKACADMPDAQAIYAAWMDIYNTNIDEQILKIYSDIEDNIKKSLEELYEL